MADIEGLIEAQELRLMQSWMHRDAGAIRSLAARDCMFMFASNPPEFLDRPSFIAAIESDLRCSGFRLGESLIRRHGRHVWYSAGCELEMQLGGKDMSGRFLISDLWRKPRIGSWHLIERSMGPVAKDDSMADSIRKLQQWR